MATTPSPTLTSRRSFVELTLIGAVGTALAASCGQAAAPTAAPALPQPTQAPAAIPPTPTQVPTPIPPTAAPTPAPTPTPAPRAKVLMILPEVSLELDLMLTKEVGVMSSMLEGAGYMVVTATESGRELMTGKSSLKPTLNLASVKADEYRGLILPCLATTSGTKIPPAAIQIAKAVAASGKPVAAQKGGVLTLGEAGVLTSRRYSLSASSRLQLAGAAVAESIWQEGVPVVQDGNITTAWSCPYTERAAGVLDTTVELTQKFIEALKAAS